MSEAKKILITGANGQLGMEFRSLADKYTGVHFVFKGSDTLSITDTQSIREYIKAGKFDYCINCAAYTAVDKAEEEFEKAEKVNGYAVGELSKTCSENGVKLFHFSTDYVFDGTADVPYQEESPLSPVNAYGRSKLLGEALALQNNERSIVIRTSWVYSTHGKNFVKTMLKLMKERDQLNVVCDQRGCPTYAADLSEAVMQIILKNNFVAGIYHYCNEGVISWHEFASAIKELTGAECIVNPIPASAYPTPAKRPAYSALDTSKIRSVYGIKIPGWKQSLEACLKKM